MKKYHLLAMAVFAMAAMFTSCDNDNEAVVTPTPEQPFVISASLGNSNTRATIEYGNQDISKGELFRWNTDDAFSVLVENGNDTELHKFTFTSFATPNEPSGTATFTCPDIVGLHAEKAIAIYPATDTKPEDNTFTSTCATEREQIGTTLGNFGKDMPMYAYTDKLASEGKLSFEHLSALLRFSITNIGPSDCTVKSIKVEANTSVFGTKGAIKSTAPGSKPTITYELNGSKSTAITTDATLKKGETIDLYTTILPCMGLKGNGTNAQLTFTLSTLRNGQEDTQSFQLDGGKINTGDGSTWEAGKRYRFKINSGYKELTVGSPTIADWSNGTDLTGGEATAE